MGVTSASGNAADPGDMTAKNKQLRSELDAMGGKPGNASLAALRAKYGNEVSKEDLEGDEDIGGPATVYEWFIHDTNGRCIKFYIRIEVGKNVLETGAYDTICS